MNVGVEMECVEAVMVSVTGFVLPQCCHSVIRRVCCCVCIRVGGVQLGRK